MKETQNMNKDFIIFFEIRKEAEVKYRGKII